MKASDYIRKAGKPTEFPDQVCLVGNSDLLMDSNLGQVIDAFPCVIRFNLGIVNKASEKFTGSRTDFRVISRMLGRGDVTGWQKDLLTKLVRRDNIICYQDARQFIKKRTNTHWVLKIQPEDCNTILRRHLGDLGNRKWAYHAHPRNGFKIVCAMVDAGVRPTLIGFDLEDRYDARHYFDNDYQSPQRNKMAHKVNWEFRYLRALAEKNLIDIVCNDKVKGAEA